MNKDCCQSRENIKTKEMEMSDLQSYSYIFRQTAEWNALTNRDKDEWRTKLKLYIESTQTAIYETELAAYLTLKRSGLEINYPEPS